MAEEKLNYYRHGDLGITQLKEKPADEMLKDHKVYKGRKFVLAEGEATGHNHVLTTESKTGFEIYKHFDKIYLKLEQPAKLTHQEHKKITIKPGIYVVKKEREHDYFQNQSRGVID